MSDLLLEWMSFRGAARIDDLPSDMIDNLAIRRAIENFCTLGHLEITGMDSWRISPPVLASLPAKGHFAEAVLCGARTRRLLDRVSEAFERHGIQLVVTPVTDGPSVIRATAPSKSDLIVAADAAGIAFQNDAPLTLLSCTPTLRNWPRVPCPMVAGRVEIVRRFSRSKLSWVMSTIAEANAVSTGFFRIKRDWDWVSILKTSATECAYIDDRAGRLLAAARTKVVTWDGPSRELTLPSQLYPPRLIARALALCSGTLPKFDAGSRVIRFAEVPPEVLRLSLAITGLRLA